MKVFIVDAFTAETFKGNPAGVCFLDGEMLPEMMLAIANELNLSGTAFIQHSGSHGTDYSIRYFSPAVEVEFCGHATLAAAKVILDRFEKTFVNFTTYHNLKLSATKRGEQICMEFPLYDVIDFAPSKELLEAFNIVEPLAIKFAKALDMLVIEVENKLTLASIKPDFAKAVQCPDAIKELVVTSKSDDNDYDFYSRCFCPWIGINEDPVTGASHSVLAKYWSTILGKNEMRAYQLSNRGGDMRLKLLAEEKLEVVSNAKVVFEGILHTS